MTQIGSRGSRDARVLSGGRSRLGGGRGGLGGGRGGLGGGCRRLSRRRGRRRGGRCRRGSCRGPPRSWSPRSWSARVSSSWTWRRRAPSGTGRRTALGRSIVVVVDRVVVDASVVVVLSPVVVVPFFCRRRCRARGWGRGHSRGRGDDDPLRRLLRGRRRRRSTWYTMVSAAPVALPVGSVATISMRFEPSAKAARQPQNAVAVSSQLDACDDHLRVRVGHAAHHDVIRAHLQAVGQRRVEQQRRRGVVSGGASARDRPRSLATSRLQQWSAPRRRARARVPGPLAVGQEGDGEHYDDPTASAPKTTLSRVPLAGNG